MQRESYVCGTSREPLKYQTIGAALSETTARFPDREAIVVRHQRARLSYRELDAAVTALAAGFLKLGLSPGERVGIWSPNKLEWVLTQLATARAGLVLVNVNPAYRTFELEYVLNKVGCRALVLADRFKSSDYVGMIAELAPEARNCAPGGLKSARLPALDTLVTIGGAGLAGAYAFEQIADMADEESRTRLATLAAGLQPDDPINIQFTSGTTGQPKGATLSHCNILNNGYFVAHGMRFTEQDRLCIPVPLYHCFGMVMGVLGCITHGATMVFPGDAFEPDAVLDTVQAESCTALYGVPTMFIAELDHPDFASYDLSTLRTGIMAGAPCPIEVMRRVVTDMNMAQVTIAYGMTETSPVSFQSAVDDPLDKRVSTVGRVLPHVQVKVIDEAGRVVPRGQSGELCTRGYSVMLGYWDDEARTSESIDAAGWMHTGDLATIDDDGYCNIVGRVKDMIIRGGENVYPREIEEFLFTHPKIRDVSAFGVPDARYGEQIAVWVCLRDGETATVDEIRQFCKGRIAHFKVPHYVSFVDGFPMTVTGKIQKFMMRRQLIDQLGLDEEKTA